MKMQNEIEPSMVIWN